MIPGSIPDPHIIMEPPAGWDEAVNGHCGKLPIRLEIHDGTQFIVSAWIPDEKELERLNKGAAVYIFISVPRQPITALSVGPVPE
jgi:hypothetical protein